MIFWITASLLAIAVTVLVGIALLRGRSDAEHPAAYDLRVYRDQLKEVDRDLTRGVIAPEDAERIRAEVGRRVLAADTQLKAAQTTDTQPKSLTIGAFGLVALALVAGSLGIYSKIGSPGARDMSLATRIEMAKDLMENRPTQAEYEADLPPVMFNDSASEEFKQLMEKLRKTVAERPDDLQGHQLLARNEAALGNLRGAYAAQQGVIRIKGDNASPEDYMMLADMMITSAQGYVSPEAEKALSAVLDRDPNNGSALYYYGLMLIQNDRPDVAFRVWDRLLRESPEDAPWVPSLRANIPEVAWRAGQSKYTPPAPRTTAPMLKGPTGEDMQNAAEMTPEERQEMIRGMVGQLSERLATDGGTPDEWARLIGAYGVLDQTDRAAEIWAEAQTVFADKPDALAVVRDGARRAGLLE